MPRSTVYDTRESLKACHHTSLNRQIGLLIEEPIFHVGKGEPTVDVEWETITVNTNSFGCVIDSMNWHNKAIKATNSIIEDLDTVIQELQLHKYRMLEELEGLKIHKRGEVVSRTPRSLGVCRAVDTVVKAAQSIFNKTKQILERREENESNRPSR